MILASAHAYDHSVDHYDQDIDRAKQDRLSGASLDGLVSIAYWIGHTRSASGHAPSARWPAPLSRSLLVCSSNAGLTARGASRGCRPEAASPVARSQARLDLRQGSHLRAATAVRKGRR